MYTLLLNGTRTTKVTDAGNAYYGFDSVRDAYLNKNHLLSLKTDQVRVLSDDYRRQIGEFLDGKLVLHRGITRQHPLWYVVRYMRILPPLGFGLLPDFATNETRFIPFSPEYVVAEAAAKSIGGMGPGDQFDMIADHETLRTSNGPVERGLIVRVVASRELPAAFYNTTEIQVCGPVVDCTIEILERPSTDLVAPPADDVEKYLERHIRLRHERTVEALNAGGAAALNRLKAIGADPLLRIKYAGIIAYLRQKVREVAAPAFDPAAVPVDVRPNYATTDADLKVFLDSTASRIAYDTFVAAIALGTDPNAAVAEAVEDAAAFLDLWRMNLPD